MTSEYGATTIDSVSFSVEDRTVTVSLKRNTFDQKNIVMGIYEQIEPNELFVSIRNDYNTSFDVSMEFLGTLLENDLTDLPNMGNHRFSEDFGLWNGENEVNCELCSVNHSSDGVVEDHRRIIYVGSKYRGSHTEGVQNPVRIDKTCLETLREHIELLINQNSGAVLTEKI